MRMKRNLICKTFVIGALLCSVSLAAQMVRAYDGVGDDSLSRIVATGFST